MKFRRFISPLLCAGLVFSATVPAQHTEGLSKDYKNVDTNRPVLCLLPGRVRKLGGRLVYPERRRPEQLVASECEIRGGEYTLFDRANYETALALWLDLATKGDVLAQVYVGEIYEKGWTGSPDYQEAFNWYSQAAEGGSRQAERRLAYFYENGLGVPPDIPKALSLWRSAMQLEDDLVLSSELEKVKTEEQRRVNRLLEQLEERNLATARLQRSLDEKEQQLTASSEQYAGTQHSIKELEMRITNARAQGGDARDVVELERQLRDRESHIQSLRDTVELLQTEVDSRSAQLASSLKRAEIKERELDAARKSIEEQSDQQLQLAAKLQSESSRVAALETELLAAQEALDKSKQHEKELVRDASASIGEQGSTQQDSQLVQQELQLARREVAIAEQTIAELVKKLDAERTLRESQLSGEQQREQQTDAKLAASITQQKSLKKDLSVAEQQSEQLAAELNSARYALSDAQAEASTLKQRLANLEQGETAEFERLEQQLRSRQNTISQLDSSRSELEKQWESAVAERNNLHQQLASEVEQRDWLEIELEATRTKLNAATADLKKLDGALQHAQFEKRQLHVDIQRLEEDMAMSQSRSVSDIRQIQQELEQARLLLASADQNSSDLQRQRSRRKIDTEIMRDEQQLQVLAMRGLEQNVAPLPKPPQNLLGPYRAIIIANHDYSFLPDLGTPRSDAVRLKRLLETRYGFKVEVQTNLNREEMFKTLQRVRKFSEDEFVLLYYAGHGKMDEFGDGYWLPTDYSEDDPLSEAISHSDITQTLRQSQARHLLLIADSCYSGALLRKGNPMASVRVPALVKFWLQNKSRTVLTSGGLQPVLDAGPDNNSVFASALLTALSENKGTLNGEMLHAAMHDRVVQEAARLGYMDQKPQFAAIEDAGHENGQFVFAPIGI